MPGITLNPEDHHRLSYLTPNLARAQAAAEAPGSVGRMLLLAAFAVSAYSSTAGRTSKPFNPLLGETYELVHAQKGFRAVVEKVGISSYFISLGSLC